MNNGKIIFYGTSWCGDCRRARYVLDKKKIKYEDINIDEDQAGEKIVLEHNKGVRSIPVIVFEDGSVLVEPSEKMLLSKIEKLNKSINP